MDKESLFVAETTTLVSVGIIPVGIPPFAQLLKVSVFLRSPRDEKENLLFLIVTVKMFSFSQRFLALTLSLGLS